MISISLKKFNDTFGHQAGDQVLILVSQRLRENVKGKDLAARYGGEEFALLLPSTPLSAAIMFTDLLRKLIEKSKITLDGSEQTVLCHSVWHSSIFRNQVEP